MQYCEMMNREVEYLAISHDTTESDLKQVIYKLIVFSLEMTCWSDEKSWTDQRISKIKPPSVQQSMVVF